MDLSKLTINNNELVTLANTLLKDLFPICRSITGDGVRETFKRLQELTEFSVLEIPSGNNCYDWEVPKEWNIKDAFIKDEEGNKIVDFKNSNLHVVNYSQPIDKKINYEELVSHIHTLPNLPDAIPYRTSYYQDNWGFCMTHNEILKLDKGNTYEVLIDTTLSDGSLSIGECILNGRSKKEFLISTYSCHPSLGNDNLSGIVLWTLLLHTLKQYNLCHTYRFIIHPETIGSIAYLSQHEKELQNIDGGFVITTVAGPDKFSYKESFDEQSDIDFAVSKTFEELNIETIVYPFNLNGSDERQFSSPAFRIPTCTISKNKYYEYPYYHTSLDNLDYIKGEYLVETLNLYLSAIQKLEMNVKFESNFKKCEPRLGKRLLYPNIGGMLNPNKSVSEDKITEDDISIIKVLNFYGNGEYTIFDVSKITGHSVSKLSKMVTLLIKKGILKEIL
jgi:aminopeptidase-like protein